MTTKLMNNLELTHIAGGVGRWYDIYTPWFSVGDKVTYKKFPEQVFTVTAQADSKATATVLNCTGTILSLLMTPTSFAKAQDSRCSPR